MAESQVAMQSCSVLVSLNFRSLRFACLSISFGTYLSLLIRNIQYVQPSTYECLIRYSSHFPGFSKRSTGLLFGTSITLENKHV